MELQKLIIYLNMKIEFFEEKNISALVIQLVNSTKKLNRDCSLMAAKTGLVVPLRGMSLLQTDGSLIVRALKSCKTGVLRKRNQCGFFLYIFNCSTNKNSKSKILVNKATRAI